MKGILRKGQRWLLVLLLAILAGRQAMGQDSSGQAQTGRVFVGARSAGAGVGAPGAGRLINMSDVGLSRYNDDPLPYVPSGTQTARFVVEHRSALNGQHVTIHGVIVTVVKGGGPGNSMTFMQPRIVVADTDSADRDTNYDVQVMLPPDNSTPYETGETLDITGTVSGNRSGVTIRKD